MSGPSASGTAISGERRLGLGSATALVIASMVGTGVFTTSGFALEALGRPERVLVAWLAGGVLAACGALSYGALARRFPESGGEYLFLSRMIHPLAGFLAGWVSLLAGLPHRSRWPRWRFMPTPGHSSASKPCARSGPPRW